MMIAPTIQQTRCKNWIHRHLPADGSVAVSDVTSAYTAICIMGPATRQLLTELTDVDLNPKNFPFFTFKVTELKNSNYPSFACCFPFSSGIRCWTCQWHSYDEFNAHRRTWLRSVYSKRGKSIISVK